MTWIKKGLIFNTNQKYHWNTSHAQVPVVDIIDDKRWRIYYATRNANNQSHTSYIEVEAHQPNNIIYEHTAPILSLGDNSSFDESGIMPTSILNYDGKKYLYYIGWKKGKEFPYQNAIGLAISEDGGQTFQKLKSEHIIGYGEKEPFFTGTCYVMKESIWRAWYLSCTGWQKIDGRMEPFYHIKYAESNDGIHWNLNEKVAIDFKSKDEGGLASASVIKENDQYYMWFCYRKSKGYRMDKAASYRIGYAESHNGINWQRMDEKANITTSESGWDSEMIAYPNVISSQGQKYMFYNGNGFGKSGLGYAVLNKK